MKSVNIIDQGVFKAESLTNILVHDSPYFKIIHFNFGPGQELPVHSHDIEGQLSILVLEGEGEFLTDDSTMAARQGDILICDIAEPHGVRAKDRMRVLVTIAPPI